MNAFDASLLGFWQNFSQLSLKFNQFISIISNNDLGKGIVTMTVFWWLWFRGDAEQQQRNRKILVSTLIGAFVALFLGRFLQVALPFRARPMHTEGFLMPLGTEKKMEEWSSFPSDHSALFYSLATGFGLISRPAGLLAYLYYFVAICVPRMYLGLHYPTDLLAGALIGAVSTLAAAALFRENLSARLLALAER